MKPKALDLFCCAGGAARGLQMAGFEVYGVDIKPQPRYAGDYFVQGDALNPPFDLGVFDFIWASPPCQHYSQSTPKAHRNKHPDLIAPVRAMLTATGKPYCIENVPSAKSHLKSPIMLCGSMFDLKIQRHRFFECFGFFMLTKSCNHDFKPVLITGTHRRTYEPRYEYSVAECRQASGIEWMTRKELDQAIPPAYSEYIGRAAMQYINTKRAA